MIKLGIAAQRTLVDYGNWILAKSFPRPMNSKHQGGEGWVVPHIKHGSVNWIQGVGGSNFPARECQPSIKGSDCFVVARPKEGKRITESSQSKYTKERGKYQLGKTYNHKVDIMNSIILPFRLELKVAEDIFRMLVYSAETDQESQLD